MNKYFARIFLFQHFTISSLFSHPSSPLFSLTSTHTFKCQLTPIYMSYKHFYKSLLPALFCLWCTTANAQQDTTTRARQLGISFEGTTGKYNAITDVPEVEVGYKTLVVGAGELVRGKGPVRTGVTVILPKGKTDKSYAAAWFSLNGDGEMTGLPYIDDYGVGYGPVGIPPLLVQASKRAAFWRKVAAWVLCGCVLVPLHSCLPSIPPT